MDLGLKGKTVLITGASKGIGRAIAEEFAAEGANLSICARGIEDLEKAAANLRSEGTSVMAVQADVTNLEDVQKVIDDTIKEFGGIDILVNNAGDAWIGHTIDTTDEEWRQCMEVNLYSAVRFTRGVAPHMRTRGGGRIINISTISGHTPVAIMPDYNSAKAAMLAFSKTMSYELAPDNILVNSVCPAFIESPLWERIADALIPAMGEDRETVYQNLVNQFVALKRFGTVKDVSGMVAFLASDRASFMTGSVYDVDGGFQKSL